MVWRVFTAFVLSGAIAGLAGVFWLAYFGSVDSTAGTGYEFEVIAAVVVGGVAIFGGSGTVLGAALGALLLNTINSALVVVRISSSWSAALEGALLLGGDHLRSARPASARTGPAHEEARELPEPESFGTRVESAVRPLIRWEGALVLMLIAVLVLGAQLSAAFWRSDNIFYVGLNIGEIAIMALPVALIVITGEIDLSIASMLGLAGTVMATLFAHGWSIWPAMLAALLVGAAGGLFNGVLVTRVGLPSLAVTIGTLTLFRGIAQILLPNNTVGGFPPSLTKIGIVPIPHTQIPYSILFFALFAIIAAVLLHVTPVGRAIFAIGANREAAFFSGIRVKRIKLLLFVASGTLAAFAGILWTLRFASARYDSGTGLELNVVTVVLLGGISIFGGRGTILGVVLAVAVIATLQSALTLALVSPQDQQIVIGGLLILSVIVPNLGDLYSRGTAPGWNRPWRAGDSRTPTGAAQ